ncbi:hypothetical protein BDN72DRAFT_873120 [Pluteus cervinus]|uniref:Uncharacterized protein n=1 Tax=Pluteus cervinus TaxID=181527 RepID=A0ACD2ZZK9_9AGAR|nr:hypothetical protein BDN72DRAFT_873120 [Pluteus cervinus]
MCFTSKTMWYSWYEIAFPPVPTYRPMEAWLERDPLTEEELEDEDLVRTYQEDTKDVWGVLKNSYNFQDLIRWVGNAEKERKEAEAEAAEAEAEAEKQARRSIRKGKERQRDKEVHPVWVIIYLLGFLPAVTALGNEQPFPDIPFAVFSQFILDTFDSQVSLSTALLLLFTLTENTELLNLHARQRSSGLNPRTGTSWIRALGKAVLRRVEVDEVKLLKDTPKALEAQIIAVSANLDAFAGVLHLLPVTDDNKFSKALKPVSHKTIEAVYTICPQSSMCQTRSCESKAIQQVTRKKNLPLVTLIKDFKIYTKVPVLSGQCIQCKTYYYSDHERFPDSARSEKGHKLYLNDAKYIKIGSNTWVDRRFTSGVLNAMYNFHGSTSAYAQFWNYTFWKNQVTTARQISHRQIWMAFLQESIRTVAQHSQVNLVLKDGISSEEVAKGAFKNLGDNGMIRAGDGHSCDECTHKYKAEADTIQPQDDGSAPIASTSNQANSDIEVDAAPVKLNVLRIWKITGEVYSVKLMKRHMETSVFYCVETVVAPCGVVIAWTLFDKAEAPTKILEFLGKVFPTPDSKPDYVCIDKACAVLRTAVASRHWGIWKHTTRFIVDAYHYANHKVTDNLCRIYCNPAPEDGSAPNLILVKRGPKGPYFQRAYNTQACEQLNAWIGGYEAILNRMTGYNFNWLLHSMLSTIRLFTSHGTYETLRVVPWYSLEQVVPWDS